jgi:type I restriction enzyme S subunit
MAVEMKDSGIQWIGEIPKHWSVEQHKRIMYKVKHIQEHYTNENILSLTMNGVIVRDLNAGGKMPTTFDGYQKVYPGNLLLCLFDIDVTPRCVGAIHDFGLTSPAYSQFVLRENAYVEYYNYLLRYMDDEKCLLHQSKNLRSSLTESDFGLIKSILPPYNEQEKISSFLDTKCGEIDELLDLETQMIDELKAYKQSIITEAVTRGLNPNVPMRDSGIEWIGEIPQHWTISPLKRLIKENLQYGANESGVNYDENLPRYVRITDISENSLKEDITKQSLTESQAFGYILEDNDILFARSGATVGKSFIYKVAYGRCAFAGYLIRAKITDTMSAEYIHYFTMTQSYEQWKNSIFIQATIQNIGADKYSMLSVPIPPLSEQQEIAKYLDSKCADIDALIALRQDKIDTLKEYKKSLIFEYVTGKKQVV